MINCTLIDIMFTKYEKNPIITPDYKLDYEKECTYNACAIVHDGKVFLIYRAEGIYGDYISTLCLATSDDGYNFTKYKNNPIIEPSLPEEERGCEDPRIIKIGDTFYLTYTALGFLDTKTKNYKAALSLASSKDLINWKKHGIIIDNNKAGQLYSEKINGEYLMFIGVGNITTATSKDLKKWKLEETPLLVPRKDNIDSHLVEVGPHPIILKDRIVLFYNSHDEWKRYHSFFAILDRKNPRKVLMRSEKPILTPSEQFELFGKVNNVIFIEGLVNFKGKYFLYYGGADKCVGVAVADENDIISYFSTLS